MTKIFESLNVHYTLDNGRCLIENLSFYLNQHDFMLVLGENGSGKSTLFKLIMQEYAATQGSLRLCNQPITAYSKPDYANQVALLSQDPNAHLCLSMTVHEHIQLYSFALNKPPTNKSDILDYLAEYHPTLAKQYNAPVRYLSGGEKQSLALALCLLRKPTLLLLDEHTSALDPVTSQKIMQLTLQMVEKNHVTCLMTTHKLSDATRYGNRIMVLHDGKIRRILEANEKCAITEEELFHSCYAETAADI